MRLELESDHGPPPLTGILVSLVGAAALIGLIFAIEPTREAILAALHGDSHGVQEQVDRLGIFGPLVVIVIAAAHAVVWYPAEILDAATGYAYGFWLAMPVVMVGWVISAWLGYWIGLGAARPLIHRLVGGERFERLERAIETGGIPLLIAIRLIPIIPFVLACLACGAARVPIWRYTWTTVVGYIPLTALMVLLGSRLAELSFTDPLLWAVLAGFALLLGAARWLMPSRSGQRG